MILLQVNGQVTSRVTQALVDEQLRLCLLQGQGSFSLTPNHPIETGNQSFQSLHVSVSEGTIWLLAEHQNHPGSGLTKAVQEREARDVLSAWLYRKAPDTSFWTPKARK